MGFQASSGKCVFPQFGTFLCEAYLQSSHISDLLSSNYSPFLVSDLSIPNTYEHSQCKVAEGIKIMLKIAATMFTWFTVVPWRRWFLETFLFCACTHCNADWMLLHKQLIWLLCIRRPFDKYCSCNLFAQGEDLSLKNIYLIYLHIILHSLKTCWQH